jgi:hypothetical protein
MPSIARLLLTSSGRGRSNDAFHAQLSVRVARQRGFVVLGVSLTDSAANLMTFRQRSRRADLTTDPPSVRGLCNRDSLFMQYFEDRW